MKPLIIRHYLVTTISIYNIYPIRSLLVIFLIYDSETRTNLHMSSVSFASLVPYIYEARSGIKIMDRRFIN